MKRKLFYFISGIDSFVETDLKYLSLYFSVNIITDNPNLKVDQACYEKIVDIKQIQLDKGKLIISFLPISLILFKDLLEHISNIRYAFNIISRGKQLFQEFWLSEKARILIQECADQGTDKPIFYSFWFCYWAMALAILKKRGIIPEFFCRAHGYDLYEDAGSIFGSHGVISFRSFMMNCVEKVYCVSKHGAEYLKGKYPQYSRKAGVSYLGSPGSGNGSVFPPNKEFLRIVSCGTVYRIKRILEIARIIGFLDFPFEWVHFGDGDEMDKLRKFVSQSKKKNQIKLMGRVENSKIHEYYKNTPVDLFINYSVNEGMPVSIIEAMSFGIPVIATDTGGTGEIVKEETGILIPIDLDLRSVAEKITEFRESGKNTLSFRENVYQFWKDNCCAENNYKKFASEIEKISG